MEAAKKVEAPKKEEPKVEEEEDFGGMDMFGWFILIYNYIMLINK